MDLTHKFALAAPLGQNYAEWSYFDGYAFQHIAAWQESRRIERIRGEARKAAAMIERRRGGRAWRR